MLKIYDSNQVSLVLFGIPIDSGFDEDTFIEIEFDEPVYQKVVSVDGEVTRSKTNNRSAKMTVSMMQTADANTPLSAILQLGLNVPVGGADVGAILVRDRNGLSIHTADQAWIAENPKVNYGKKGTPRQWIIETGKMLSILGGT